MKHVIGVAAMKVSADPADLLVTHALGSCLGLAAYDPTARVGGLAHLMMPLSKINPKKAEGNPFYFVDTGVPQFFEDLYAAGASKQRIRLKVAGGANVHQSTGDRFAIGRRNFVVLKKLLWKNGVLIDAEDVGGDRARTMYLELASGRVWISSGGEQWTV